MDLGGWDHLGERRRQLLMLRFGSLQQSVADSPAWKIFLIDGASGSDCGTATWLVAD
jgi:hypothetical protein